MSYSDSWDHNIIIQYAPGYHWRACRSEDIDNKTGEMRSSAIFGLSDTAVGALHSLLILLDRNKNGRN